MYIGRYLYTGMQGSIMILLRLIAQVMYALV